MVRVHGWRSSIALRPPKRATSSRRGGALELPLSSEIEDEGQETLTATERSVHGIDAPPPLWPMAPPRTLLSR